MDRSLLHPNSRFVDAYVGSFQSDYFGNFTGQNAPLKAIDAAREAGHKFVSLMYGNGNMETVETTE